MAEPVVVADQTRTWAVDNPRQLDHNGVAFLVVQLAMKRIHTSRNLTIDHDVDASRYIVTVTFHEDAIIGHAEARCPRCGAHSHVTFWELEGPGGETNILWLVCAGEPPCKLRDQVLRWSANISFERDWDDL